MGDTNLFSNSLQFVEQLIQDQKVDKPQPPATCISAEKMHSDEPKKQNRPSVASKEQSNGERSSLSMIHFVAGTILEARKHPDSTKLLIETIDCGEKAPRTICSGIAEYYQPEDMVNRTVVVVANLEPRKIAGVLSEGMVLCASSGQDQERKVELLTVPQSTRPGYRFVFPNHDVDETPVLLKKKLAKHWEQVAQKLHTDANRVVCFENLRFLNGAGEAVTAPTLPNAIVS